MNWENLCPGCMHELTEEEITVDVCPHCGYEKNKKEPEGALPILTILSGKYLIGKVLETDSTGFTYLAYDLNLEVKIQITEYFPYVLVKRDEDRRSVVPVSDETKEAYSQGVKNHLENTRQIVKMVTRSGGENIIRDCFEENNTVYTALVDIAAPTVTTMPSQEEKEESKEKKTVQKKKMFLITGSFLAVVVIVAAVFLIVNHLSKFKINKDWEAVYKASMLGTLYKDDIMVFSTENNLYYSEYDENGNLPSLYWLAGLNVNETIYCVDSDDKYLYVSITGNGIFRAEVENKKEVVYEQIVSRNSVEFLLYDKFIYYTENDVLYKAKKDGSDEIVLAKNASDVYSIYDGWMFYYSDADGSIYRVKLNGKDAVKVRDVKGCIHMQAVEDCLWLVCDNTLYRIDLNTGDFIEKDGVAEIGNTSEIYAMNSGKSFWISYLSKDYTSLNWIFNDNFEAFEGEEESRDDGVFHQENGGNYIIMNAVFGDKVCMVNNLGEYIFIDVTTEEVLKPDFNYFSMSEDCLE